MIARPADADPRSEPPLVAHVVHRFAVGGTENGIVNVINRFPPGAYRHVIVALADVDPSFAARLHSAATRLVSLHKRSGHGVWLYPRLYRLFRELRPAIVHTRSLAALEVAPSAWAAGVPIRIHGEHGWDIRDPGGRNARYFWLRRIYRPFVSRYVSVCQGLTRYLCRVGVPVSSIEQIYNGVDVDRYRPRRDGVDAAVADCPFVPGHHWLAGSVGRMHEVKDPLTLVRAFIMALRMSPAAASRLRLVMIGDGPLRSSAQHELAVAGLGDHAWLPGERADIPALMRTLDCFVLPSIAEGMSNTILEAMASGLPVIATDVGGNPELVRGGETGELVAPGDPEALAARILGLASDPALARSYGRAGRARAEAEFGLDGMAQRYLRLYDSMLANVKAAPHRMRSA